jgi:hypothetical protein
VVAAGWHSGLVSLSDDLPPPRRPLFFPVVIATTFLSIIGISVGLLLGSQRDQNQAAQQQTDRPAVTTTSAGPEPSVEAKPSGKPCRPETQAAAEQVGVVGTLVVVLHVRTRSSALWVCRDPEDTLYYHANNGGGRWIEGETALFLPSAVRGDDDYHATADDGAVFSVNK